MTERHTRHVVVASGVQDLIRVAAERFVDVAQAAVSARSMFSVALSGGNTPRPLYQALAAPPYRDQIDWHHVQVFFSDERFVPPDSPESNYHLAHETLLSRVPIPERFVHRVATVDISPEEAAALYAEGIRRDFQVGMAEIPRFDLILLGMGPDGHTASLFPDTAALDVTDRLVVANFVPRMDAWRVTFTYPLLDAARNVTFLVGGADKAERVREVFTGQGDLPAALVRPTDGQEVWLLDQAAAVQLPRAAGHEAGEAPPGR